MHSHRLLDLSLGARLTCAALELLLSLKSSHTNEVPGVICDNKRYAKGINRVKVNVWERKVSILRYLVSSDCDRDPGSGRKYSFYLEISQDEGLINPHIIKSPSCQTLFAPEENFSRFLSTHCLTHPLAEEQSADRTSFGRG